MTRRKSKSPWRLYMTGNGGGYYIVKEGDRAYGPFKSKKIAEFFNFLAFGDPRSPLAKHEAASGIKYLKSIINPIHPSEMFASNSKFSLWWEDIFDTIPTTEIMMSLARETRAQGYKSFIDWILDGSQIDGKHIMARPN